MADEQIIVDIKVEDKEVKQAEKSIDKLTDSIEELGNRIKTARDQNKEYQKQQKELNDLYKKGTITTETYEKEVDKLNVKIKTNNKVIAQSTVELGDQKRERTANLKLINTEISTRDRLRQKIALLTREYNGLNTEEEEGRKQSIKLQKELKELNEELNQGSLAAGNFKDNIGNYPEASGAAIVSLNELGDGMEAVGGSSANAVGGIKSMGQAFKALLANPVVLTLVAVVAALSALYSAFKESASGSRLLSRANAALNGSWAIVTRAVNEFGEAATKAFDESNEGTVGFWQALKQNVVDRLQAVVTLFQSVGKGLKALWQGNTEALKEAAKEAKDSLVQIVTGLDESGIDRVLDKFKEFAGVAALITKSYIDLEKAQFKQRESSRFLEKSIAKLSAEFEMLSEVAGDDTRSMNEMREASIKAGTVAEKLAKKQVALARSRLAIINQEVAVNRSAGKDIQELLDQQAQAYVQLTEARSQAAIASQKTAIEQRKIERDIFEQNLDILIDVGDKIKTEQEKQIKNEALSLNKRKSLLAASKAALAANFEAIKEEYGLYGVKVSDINDIIAESDARQSNEKLKALGLNEIATNRLREIILERKQAELDFNDLSQELSEEEIKRRTKASKKIKKINDKTTISEIDNAEELRDALIEIQKQLLSTKLEDETLLAIERQALTLETEANIKQIEKDFSDDRIADKLEEKEALIAIIESSYNEIANITREFAGTEGAIFNAMAESIIDNFKKGEISAVDALRGIQNFSNALFDQQKEKRDEDLDDNERFREAELGLAKGNKEAEDRINEEYDKKATAIKLKQFKGDKAKALLDIGIATAVGAASALPNLILAGIVTAFGLLQLGIVASKKPPKYGGGTSNIVSIGDSHASGRDTDVWGYSGGQSQYFGKVERGEAMPVIRKSAANDYMISKLNGKFDGWGGNYANGTPDITAQPQVQQRDDDKFISDLVNAFGNVQIVAKIEDITKEARKKVQIVDNSKV